MAYTHPRRTAKTTSSEMNLSSSSSPAVKSTMFLRKGATFHSQPLSERSCNIPSLPRRSETSLDDVIDAHRRRMTLTLEDLDRSLSCLSVGSPPSTGQSFQDNGLPGPSSVLNHTVDLFRAQSNQSSNTTTNLTKESLQKDRLSHRSTHTYHPSTSTHSVNDSDSMSESGSSTSTAATSVDSRSSKPVMTASVEDPQLPAPASVHASHLIQDLGYSSSKQSVTVSVARGLGSQVSSRLSTRANNKMREHILRPLLSKASFKDFHPIVEDCPRRIHNKEITCLRDLEKALIFNAPKRAKTAQLYLDFCITSIHCIQATVEFLNEPDLTRPNERPYTNGYFIDLVDQIKNYAHQVNITSREAEAKEEGLSATERPSSTDEIKLYGGISRNGRPAELVRIKNGEAFSLATGLPVKMESIEVDEKGGNAMKRSLSMEDDQESIQRSMARRKRDASALPPPPKVCSTPGCNKQFKRACDLTKHEKTHSRPWKCQESDCKYHAQGWPTEKELQRHVNDKHSANPHYYHCMFTPCVYRSKRDSNRKQHMEKAHEWDYVRAKNNKPKGDLSDFGSATGSDFTATKKPKPRVKASAATLQTPQTLDHRTPESDLQGQFTPQVEEEDWAMADDYKSSFEISLDSPEEIDLTYPSGELEIDNPYVSPDASENFNTPSTEASPVFLQSHVFASSANTFAANHGPGDIDFTLYEEEDIYNARALLPPSPAIDYLLSSFDCAANNYFQRNQLPLFSPMGGSGDQMLFTPPTEQDDNLGFSTSDQMDSGDFQLFASSSTSMNDTPSYMGDMTPSSIGNFAPNSLEFFHAFYQPLESGADEMDIDTFIHQASGIDFTSR